MSEENKESLALFARPQSSYTSEPTYPEVEDNNVEPLPLRTSSVQGEGRSGEEFDSGDTEMEMFSDFLGQIHEKALSAAGFGRLQWTLFVVLGLGIMGDNIELLVIAFILPGAEKELCMTEQMKGWLGKRNFFLLFLWIILWTSLFVPV